MKSCCQSRDRQ